MLIMAFKAKIDHYYLTFIGIISLVLALALFTPLFFREVYSVLVILILGGVFIILIGLILWSTFSIEYVFTAEHLFIKGGPYRSKIPYESITKVTYTNKILTGYRVMSAREGIELFYRGALLGSVKISPLDEETFIAELVKRRPSIEVKV